MSDVKPEFAPDRREFYLGDPHAAYRRLRREDPLPWYEPGRFWCVLKHADIEEVSRSPQVFSSAQGIVLGGLHGDRNQAEDAGLAAPSIIQMDPPEHNRHRKLVIQAFTPRMVSELEPRIRDIARKSLDAIPTGERVDFVDAVAVPLPMLVIAEMLGIPGEDRADFKRWSDAMIEAASVGNDPATTATIADFSGYMLQHVAARRAEPRDDLVSALAAAEIEGERLTDPEMMIFLLTLLVAGNETTRNLLAGGARELMRHPDQCRWLREDLTRIPNAVEEMLRFTTPVMNFVRRATQDTELRGRRIAANDYLLLIYGSANRDEEIWGEDSEVFDVTRSHAHRRHVAFGFGEHLCLGASLARLEARVMFEELLTRFPDFEPAGPVEHLPSTLMNGVVKMPVIFRS